MSLLNRIGPSRIWRSIFRDPPPVDPKGRAGVIRSNVFLHVHPVAIPTHALRIGFTWCMGGITFFLFVVELLTGVLLMFYYRPTLEWAYHDLLDLRDVVSFGLLRELHRWAAHAMVVTVMLHLLRVFLTGSYKPPREFNWVIGVCLLVLTLLLSFTGYLLPWDQLAYWAVTVGTNMAAAAPWFGPGFRYLLLGGNTVGEPTLIRFYVLHCLALPLAVIVLLAVHFWRIRKDGISGPL